MRLNLEPHVHFATGVFLTGGAILAYQLINHYHGNPGLWTLLPGLLIMSLSVATLYRRTIWPAFAGYVFSIPLTAISSIGLLLPISPEPPLWILRLWHLLVVLMAVGILYSTAVGVGMGYAWWQDRRWLD